MKKLLTIVLMAFAIACAGQDPDQYLGPIGKDTTVSVDKTAACGTPFVSTGYPAWSNYWGGYMINIINTSGTQLNIRSFEARFQGTAGYRIYTKTGTFVGFETNAAAWTLVGQINGGLAGLGTTVPTPIPITVDVCIPIGGTQAFYLSRSNNNTGNRHLYVPGTGTPGTTVYASDANLSITEAHYVTPFFAANYAQARRPSLDVCYTLGCTVLPVDIVNFYCKDSTLTWVTATEINCSHYELETSEDGVNFEYHSSILGAGNSNTPILYEVPVDGTYVRLKQVDFNGNYSYYGPAYCGDYEFVETKEERYFNIKMQEVDEILPNQITVIKTGNSYRKVFRLAVD